MLLLSALNPFEVLLAQHDLQIGAIGESSLARMIHEHAH